MVKRSENVLHGMKAICQYYGRSEATILKLHRDSGMPIKRTSGGWSADKKTIDEWHADFITGETEAWLK